MKMEEKRKYEEVETAEILNYINKEEENTDYGKVSDYKEELELRTPFRHMKYKIDKMQKKIEKLNDIIEILVNHKHDSNGNVVIDTKTLVEELDYKMW